jgi:RNA polymerase sigma factor (sigma-70 family)
MAGKSKTEITIETDRMFIIRRRSTLIQTWCAACFEVVKMAALEDAANLAGMRSREVYRAVEAGKLHFLETVEGRLLVCLNSLAIVSGKVTEDMSRECVVEPPLRLIKATGRDDSFEPSEALQVLKETNRQIVKRDGSTSRKKEWVLTREALDKLLVFLDKNRERAASRYEIIRRKLMKYFECRRCCSPEDLADETINRVARKILEGKEIWTNDPANYFYGVARNVLKEYRTELERELSLLETLPSLTRPCENTLRQQEIEFERNNLEQQLACLEYCLQQLSPDNRQIIVNYYQGEKGERIKNRKLIAERLGIPTNALRIRVHRIREKLEQSVIERLRSLQGV